MSYPIQPIEKPQSPIIISSVSISVSQVVLGVSALVEVKSLNPDGLVVEVQYLTLSQPDYSYWGSDDSFIVNWVFTQLGLSPPTA